MPELRQREIGAVAALLCTHCDNILDSLEGLQLGNMTPWMDVSYHVNICGIKEAAKSGCELCRVILAGFRTEHLQRLSAEPNTQLKARIGMFTSQDLSLVFQCCEATTSFRAKEKSSIRMAIHAQLPDEAGKCLWQYSVASWLMLSLEKIPSIPKSTGDVEALNLAKQWLEHCVQNHEACRPPESNDGPARIVSIGSNTSRLVPLSELPDRFEYATLSHCWGNIQYLKLLKDNLEEFQHQIPAHRLSKTFTDAIKITKHLGISYLWVDSLCIIQDDGDDWHRESKKMSTIYGCSTINIAATGAENGSIGCFFDRDSDLRDKLRKARIPERIVQEKVLITYDCIRDSICQDDIDIAPLASRGWCFQERFLPARALHFAKSQIWWKCQCYGACESFPDGIPLGLGLPNVKSRATKLFEKNHAQSLEAEHVMLSVSANTELGMLPDVHFWDQSKLETATSLAAAWEKAVEIYSGTRLTRSRDKLIAIAGVAEWFSGRNGDEYVAGFWRQYLETQLLWYTAETQHETCDYDTKATEYLAPSWSWASTRCRVKYKRAFDVQDYDDEEQTWTQNINVVNVSIELSDPSFLYGVLSGGTIRLAFSKLLCGTSEWAKPEAERFLYWDSLEKHQDLLYFLPVYSCCDSCSSELCFHEGLVLKARTFEKRIFQRVGYWMAGGCMHGLDTADLDGFERDTSSDRARTFKNRIFQRVGYWLAGGCGCIDGLDTADLDGFEQDTSSGRARYILSIT